jgi:methyltransferase family protein
LAHLQELAFPSGHDYTVGSPHLKHARLRGWIDDGLSAEVARLTDRFRECRVLEIGAGHGPFTAVLRRAGALVTLTEMSRPSVDHLRRSFGADPGVTVIHDPDGSWVERSTDQFHMVVAISVLHHIPDYVSAVRLYAERTVTGGSFLSWQDPLWYARLPTRTAAASRIAYLAWRVGQGNLRRGLTTQSRRIRRVYDESNPSDMSEYHVVREGVDELALTELLAGRYHDVGLSRYWSTQGSFFQKVGERIGLETHFAITARNRH